MVSEVAETVLAFRDFGRANDTLSTRTKRASLQV